MWTSTVLLPSATLIPWPDYSSMLTTVIIVMVMTLMTMPWVFDGVDRWWPRFEECALFATFEVSIVTLLVRRPLLE